MPRICVRLAPLPHVFRHLALCWPSQSDSIRFIRSCLITHRAVGDSVRGRCAVLTRWSTTIQCTFCVPKKAFACLFYCILHFFDFMWKLHFSVDSRSCEV